MVETGKKKTYIKYVIAFAALMIFAAGCADNNPTGQAVSENAASPQQGEVKEFTVNSFRFGFEPDTLLVNQGDLVRINANTLDIPHGLAIAGYGVNMYLAGSQLETVEFVANKKGTFAIYCSVPCGAGHNSMRGTLVVQ